MADIFALLMANLDVIFAVLAALHVAALAIVNATPTPKDDAWVARIYGVIEVLAGLLTSKAKDPAPKEVAREIEKNAAGTDPSVLADRMRQYERP